MKFSKTEAFWTVSRLVMGFIFLWAFLDKLFGLGYSTSSKMAWLNGGSPTSGFLKSLTGTFHSLFTPLAGNSLVDWLFMLGLLVVGLTLILGIFTRFGSFTAISMLVLLAIAAYPSKTNPLVDDHIVDILMFTGIIIYNPVKYLSLDFISRRMFKKS